jgi:hypothetical protein
MVDGTNLYGYSRNNPVNRRDPSGTQSEGENSGDSSEQSGGSATSTVYLVITGTFNKSAEASEALSETVASAAKGAGSSINKSLRDKVGAGGAAAAAALVHTGIQFGGETVIGVLGVPAMVKSSKKMVGAAWQSFNQGNYVRGGEFVGIVTFQVATELLPGDVSAKTVFRRAGRKSPKAEQPVPLRTREVERSDQQLRNSTPEHEPEHPGINPRRKAQAEAAEAQALRDIGVQKNTDEFDATIRVKGASTSQPTIPDAVTDSKIIEVKTEKSLDLTKQIRAQVQVAKKQDKKYELWVGQNTDLSGPIKRNDNIHVERRKYLNSPTKD